MKKHRIDAKIDANQPGIVEKLRNTGLSVELDHDDIVVGCDFIKWLPLTFWFEIKNPETSCSKKTGKILESEIKPDQKRIRSEFKGHYKIVSSYSEIMQEIENVVRKIEKRLK